MIALIPMEVTMKRVVIGSLDSGLGVRSLLELGIITSVIMASLITIFALVSYPKWVQRLEHLFTVGISQPVVAGVGLCFGSAALFGSVGLSSAYGAFAMGLLLGNIGSIGATYRKAVAPIHDVLVMVFFMSIGLLVDINFVVEHWFEIVVTVCVAIVFKILVPFNASIALISRSLFIIDLREKPTITGQSNCRKCWRLLSN